MFSNKQNKIVHSKYCLTNTKAAQLYEVHSSPKHNDEGRICYGIIVISLIYNIIFFFNRFRIHSIALTAKPKCLQ